MCENCKANDGGADSSVPMMTPRPRGLIGADRLDGPRRVDGIGAKVSPRGGGAVFEALTALEVAVEGIEGSCDRLSIKLQPILGSEVPMNAESNKVDEHPSEVVAKIERLRRRLIQLSNGVATITDRVEL